MHIEGIVKKLKKLPIEKFMLIFWAIIAILTILLILSYFEDSPPCPQEFHMGPNLNTSITTKEIAMHEFKKYLMLEEQFFFDEDLLNNLDADKILYKKIKVDINGGDISEIEAWVLSDYAAIGNNGQLYYRIFCA